MRVMMMILMMMIWELGWWGQGYDGSGRCWKDVLRCWRLMICIFPGRNEFAGYYRVPATDAAEAEGSDEGEGDRRCLFCVWCGKYLPYSHMRLNKRTYMKLNHVWHICSTQKYATPHTNKFTAYNLYLTHIWSQTNRNQPASIFALNKTS